MANIVVKAWYEGENGQTEIRRFNVPDDADSLYDVIEKKVSEVFEKLQKGQFSMFWKDEDSDLVIISSQEELEQALNEATEGLLRIVLKDKDGGVTSPERKLVNDPVSSKAQRIQQRREDKARQPPRWMRRCKEAMAPGETGRGTGVRPDVSAFLAQDLARRRSRRRCQVNNEDSEEECQTTIAHAKGWQGRHVPRDNPDKSPQSEERLQRRERRRQQWLEVQRQSETDGGDSPRLMPRWMARRLARETEAKNTTLGNGNQGNVNETCTRPMPRWMARRIAREAEDSHEMTQLDGNHTNVDAAEAEEADGPRCKNRMFWRRMNGEADTGDANFASCQRRRLRRMRQEAIMRAMVSERMGQSEGTGGGWNARRCSRRRAHFQEEPSQENVEAETMKANITEEPCNVMKMRRGRKWGGMRQQRKQDGPGTGDSLESEDIPVRRQRRTAQEPGRTCRRNLTKHLCDEDSGASPNVRAFLVTGRMRRETTLTNYRLRVLRRLRRMRQLKAMKLSGQACPDFVGARRFRKQACPQETFSTCGNRCMNSPRRNKVVLFSLKPYHGFRRYGGQMKARSGCPGKKEYRQTSVIMLQDKPALRWRQLIQKRQLPNISQRAQRREMKRAFRKHGFGKLRRFQGIQMHKQMTSGEKRCPLQMTVRLNGPNRPGNLGCFRGPQMPYQKAGQKKIRLALRPNGKEHGQLMNLFMKADRTRAWSKGCPEGIRLRQNRRMMGGSGLRRSGPCAGRRYPVYGF